MSQSQTVLEHLKRGRKITSLSAVTMYGILCLPKRISELIQAGYKIRKVTQEVQKADGSYCRVKVYSLKEQSV